MLSIGKKADLDLIAIAVPDFSAIMIRSWAATNELLNTPAWIWKCEAHPNMALYGTLGGRATQLSSFDLMIRLAKRNAVPKLSTLSQISLASQYKVGLESKFMTEESDCEKISD